MADQVRLGGMALENGVLVHGPRHWGCAVRTEDGELRVASGRKPLRAADVEIDLLRGGERPPEVVGRSDYYVLLNRGGSIGPFVRPGGGGARLDLQPRSNGKDRRYLKRCRFPDLGSSSCCW